AAASGSPTGMLAPWGSRAAPVCGIVTYARRRVSSPLLAALDHHEPVLGGPAGHQGLRLHHPRDRLRSHLGQRPQTFWAPPLAVEEGEIRAGADGASAAVVLSGI